MTLPITKQATSLEVEGDTTVEVTGTDGQGNQLEGEIDQSSENQTADIQGEEPKQTEPKGDAGISSEGQEVSDGTRHERRTEKLIDKLKEKTDEASALRRQLEGNKPVPAQPEPQLPPWLQPSMPDEVTLEEYRANVADTARNLVKTELSAFQDKVMKYESFKEDLNKVEAKYPILNADSDSYDKEKAAQVAKLYQAASAGDPSLRLSEFVDSIMSFHEAGQESGKEQLKTSVIRKDAESAVTPNSTTGEPDRKSDDWDSMTLKQKEEWMKANGFWD